jgi:hypothetical protein
MSENIISLWVLMISARDNGPCACVLGRKASDLGFKRN